MFGALYNSMQSNVFISDSVLSFLKVRLKCKGEIADLKYKTTSKYFESTINYSQVLEKYDRAQ